MSKQGKKGTIRIISGAMRGRKVTVLDADGLRPTTDRVRETLFNWLMYDISESNCLDLFAGTGSLGLECLSRGARKVTFVEKNTLAAQAIVDVLHSAKVDDIDSRAIVKNIDAHRFLKVPQEQQYELVFLDPPFAQELCISSSVLLEESNLLTENALIYIEQDARAELVGLPSNWVKLKEGRVGQSSFYLFRRSNKEGAI